ncbi:response regulator transcription factor [Helicobacter sp. MIT 14-3879]|uniref:response regulator transcription factor n=1 Tax=Helicobacter sp. MIT 14-3879 TaxID=2040649 RepID=UPI000E1F79FD|nr:response regulator transcription factor [Helicobacter sp. MIT 14-3879]RDU65477.1 two-component system response regulator [Helicobacter sp. MIT 14-3879]
MSAKILLLEDDFSLSEILCEFLGEEGFEVHCVQDATNALNLAYEMQFDLWLLDVKVPLGDDFKTRDYLPGFELLKSLRSLNKTTPCIFITSLSSVLDIKDGYDVGCDDFLKKPFELVELKCRIQTLLKRSFAHIGDEFLDLGDGFRFNLISKLLYKDKSIIPLTKKESKLLSLLLKNINSYVPLETIFEELWDFNQEPSEMSLRAYIKNLRKILGRDKILNQHSSGYCYVC